MAKTEQTFHDDKKGTWKITYKDSKGDEKVRDTIPDVPALGLSESVKTFQGLVAKETDARRAALSLLCLIYNSEPSRFSEWLGKGDKATGQLSNGLKDEYRKAEDTFFGQFLDPKHEQHKGYVAGLPKINERGEKLEAEGAGEQIRERHNYFVTRTRKAPSYANAKNLFLRFIAFVGRSPMSDDGTTIIPPEVMRVMIDAALNLPAPDNSYAARLMPMLKELVMPADPEKPVPVRSEQWPELVSMLRRALEVAEERGNQAAAAAMRQRETMGNGGGVQQKADNAIASAQATLNAAKEGQAKAEPKSKGQPQKAEV